MGKQSLKVLLIEDDPDFTTLIQEGLCLSKTPTFDVETARTLTEGLASLKKGNTDVVLLDLSLPDSEGMDTLRKLYAQIESLPIVVLTGAYDESIAIKVLKEGAQDYLTKGKIDRDMIIRSIRYAMGRSEQESRIKHIISSIPSILIGIAPDDTITHWNRAAEEIFGINHREVLGKPFHQCGIRWDFNHLLQAIVRCRKENKPIPVDDVPFKSPDGKPGLLGFTVNPVKEVSSSPEGILLFGADITEKRQLEARLRQASKMESLGEVAGAIAHEFRNMLNQLLGFVQLTQKRLPQGTREHEYLEKAQALALRANEFAKQILTFGRKGDEKRYPVELTQVVQEALGLIQELMPPQVEVISNLTPNSSTILADKNQIHQVLMNLSTNASYAMRKSSGTLRISVKTVQAGATLTHLSPDLSSGPYVKLTVSDTGEGIPPEVMNQIFEPFFSTKPEAEGTGMGLAVVYGIVKSHGGVMTVSSEVGHGTTFDIYFPPIH